MQALTEAQILQDIEPFKHEWIYDQQWWYGNSRSFKNAIYGYDVNLCNNKETNKIEALVYALIPENENEKRGHLVTAKDTLMKFEIKIDYQKWERGEILTPIALEDGAPFEIGKNYLITKVEDNQKKGLKVYTLNEYIDFRYTDFEISAFFKKAVL